MRHCVQLTRQARGRRVGQRFTPAGGNDYASAPWSARGLSLIEMILALAILTIVVSGLASVVRLVSGGYRSTQDRQRQMASVRYALDWMGAFVAQADAVYAPGLGATTEVLSVDERVLDISSNLTHAATPAGDGYLDADDDANGLVNEGPASIDGPNPISFQLDRSIATNWQLIQSYPCYAPGAAVLTTNRTVLCESVSQFRCAMISTGLVEVTLSAGSGPAAVTLRTRFLARLLQPL